MTNLALLQTIIEHPDDDVPRLMFADAVEDEQPERCAFIRCQVELASLNGADISESPVNPEHRAIDSRKSELRRRERELWGSWPDTNDMRAKIREECPALAEWVILPESLVSWRENVDRLAAVSRGFVSQIRCSWSDLLRVAPSLLWWRGSSDECRTCDGRGKDAYVIGAFGPFPNGCPHCNGGRIPRPMPPTAQPIQLVRLSSGIASNEATVTRFIDSFMVDGFTFDRVKCQTCNGHVIDDYRGRNLAPCPECHGTPLNRWTCADRFGPVVFEMPEAGYRAHVNQSIRDIAAGMGQTWRYGT